MILCGYRYEASLDPNAYSYADAETDSVSKPILISEPIPMPVPILIPEPFPISIPITEPIPESISETDSGPTIRNQFLKTSELAGINSDETFIFPTTLSKDSGQLWAASDDSDSEHSKSPI